MFLETNCQSNNGACCLCFVHFAKKLHNQQNHFNVTNLILTRSPADMRRPSRSQLTSGTGKPAAVHVNFTD